MLEGKRFPFIERSITVGVSSAMPYLPLTLSFRNRAIEVMALLDTGASVNVLPYEIGLQLGAIWEEQTVPIQLSGNLASMEARGLVLSAKVAEFPPVLLAFAWTKSTEAPLILGHMNFFTEFDVCFYRADLAFEVRPRRK
ncbi:MULTISPECIES: retroviral-like aspartic protease [Calothrix]|uniref:Retroviral-like aspartic protease n=2 Tax=Calothrix TaxID=1186 RepID=A0ABR8A6C2_9CYAN|nr:MULTISPECIES: retroviral-like aspartic protease [Calothrix]MBD2195481.1 retroviral-like aspartic protease [Calothrix parietina FACHB-288]MBD2223143.1 retroviral-like aspartic protease [Calothrix anomala FACHB-343]